MKTWPSCLCAIVLAGWLPLAGAQEQPPPQTDDARQVQREDVQKEVEEAIEAVRGYSADRNREALARARDSLARADRRMAQLEREMNERWGRMSTATRQRNQETVAQLRSQRLEVAEWIGAMKHSSGDAWEEVKTGFAGSYRAFTDALGRARAQFDRDKVHDQPPDDKTSRERQEEER